MLIWCAIISIGNLPPVQVSRRLLAEAPPPGLARRRATLSWEELNATARFDALMASDVGAASVWANASAPRVDAAKTAAVPVAAGAEGDFESDDPEEEDAAVKEEKAVEHIQDKIVLVRHRPKAPGLNVTGAGANVTDGTSIVANASNATLSLGSRAHSSAASLISASDVVPTSADDRVLEKTKKALNLAQGTTDKIAAVALLGKDVKEKLASIAAGIKSLETMDAIEHVSAKDGSALNGAPSKSGLLTTASGHLRSDRASAKRASMIVAVEKAERAGLNETLVSAAALIDQTQSALREVVESHAKQTAELRSLRKSQKKHEFEHAVEDELLKQVESKTGVDFEDGRMKLDIDAAVDRAGVNVAKRQGARRARERESAVAAEKGAAAGEAGRSSRGGAAPAAASAVSRVGSTARAVIPSALLRNTGTAGIADAAGGAAEETEAAGSDTEAEAEAEAEAVAEENVLTDAEEDAIVANVARVIYGKGNSAKSMAKAMRDPGEFLVCTVTFYANRAHNLTRSP